MLYALKNNGSDLNKSHLKIYNINKRRNIKYDPNKTISSRRCVN